MVRVRVRARVRARVRVGVSGSYEIVPECLSGPSVSILSLGAMPTVTNLRPQQTVPLYRGSC